jgi:hypothetical protein
VGTLEPVDEATRRKRIRRTALLFGGIALAFYLAFIVLAVARNSP